MAKTIGFDHRPATCAYNSIHRWMNRHFPRTGRCEWCASRGRFTEYATARHGVFTRNRADWLELCRHCHNAFDGGNSPAQRAAAKRIGQAKLGTKVHDTSRMTTASRRRAKLTPALAREIRWRYAAGESYAQLASCFGVHLQTIAPLVRGTTWRNV